MPRSIEWESASDDHTRGNFLSDIVPDLLMGAWMRRQNQRLPAEMPQVTGETERSQNSAAPGLQRRVEGDHQEAIHGMAMLLCVSPLSCQLWSLARRDDCSRWSIYIVFPEKKKTPPERGCVC